MSKVFILSHVCFTYCVNYIEFENTIFKIIKRLASVLGYVTMIQQNMFS